MQIRDGMHNVLQVDDTCAHLLNEMIKHAKKDALAREARDSETLAKDLADKLGVDFVETTKDDD